MRVITGKAKGHRIRAVPGATTRPITDRAKSALFSILGEKVTGSRFLDLFAGTGQVAIEALSRGADSAVLVEQSPLAVRTIRLNLAHTGLTERARVVRADVFRFLERQPEPFDLIYVAPPQYRGLWARTLERLDRREAWLAPEGLIVAQIHPREFEPLALERLALADRRDYGSVTLLFFEDVERLGPATGTRPE